MKLRIFGEIGRFVYGILAELVHYMGLNRLRIVNKIGASLRRGIRRFLPEEVRVKVYGLTLNVPRDFAFLGVRPYEPETTNLILSLLKPGMTFVDIGAHVGYYSLIASRKIGPVGKVFSFEPDPRNYALLTANISANNCTNVIPVQKAIADYTGKGRLFLATYSVSHSLYKDNSIPISLAIEIDVVSLDDYFRQLDWPSVDVIKMDIEGAEIPALRGMRELSSRNPSLKLILEFKPRRILAAGHTVEEFFCVLTELGFTFIQDINTGEWVLSPREERQLNIPSKSTNLFCFKALV